MMLRAVLLVVLVQATLGLFPTTWRSRQMRTAEFGSKFRRRPAASGVPNVAFAAAPAAAAAVDDDASTTAATRPPQTAVTQAFFSQVTDHFDNSTTRATFTQRYFYADEYARGPSAFLVIDADSPADGSWLADTTMPIVQRARQFGAILFLLEHRFYGQSRPFVNQTVENLKFLTASQAIEDAATFIAYANKRFNLPANVRWIVFGAGYGSNLAAWLRLTHPELVVGAVASSAPLQSKLDFWEYMEQVQWSIEEYASYECYMNISIVFKDIAAKMMSPEGRVQIDAGLPLQTPLANLNLTYNDIQQLYSVLLEPFQITVQFDFEFGLSTDDLCAVMTNSTLDSLAKLKGAYNYLLNDLGPDTIDAKMPNDYMLAVQKLQDETYTDINVASERSYFWQACKEFGGFPTTNTDMQNIFGASLPTNVYINQCQDVFGKELFSAIKMRDSIEATNTAYGGGDFYAGTNVVFTYGTLDPYYRIGNTYPHDPSVAVYFISDAGFAEDVFPRSASVNNPDLDRAQKTIDNNVYKWLYGPINPNTRANMSSTFSRNFRWPARAQALAKTAVNAKTTLTKSASKPRTDRTSPGLFAGLANDVPSKKVFPEWKKHKKVWLGRPPHGFKPLPPAADNGQSAGFPPDFEVGTFRQAVDHFDSSNPDTFQQKYYKNAQWAKPGGPNFLMIGGEGPESDRWVLSENLTYLTWAQKYGATVYLLEHRFYGDSVVGNNDQLYFLNSMQMLYDLAEFIKGTNFKTGNTAPWITFGGSYSGALSLWMRQQFPGLVAGAVGSSGPVFAKVDFFEYLLVVEKSIRTYSDDCANRIGVAFDEMHRMVLSPAGRVNLTTIFTLDPPWTVDSVVGEIDTAYFFSNIFGNFQGAVQYSGDNTGPYANGYGIPDMCKIMLNDSNTPLQNVANFNVFMTEFYTGEAFHGTDNMYQDMIDALRNAQQYGPESAASLLWTWQTCSEFGYFQSTDLGDGIFGSPTPVNMYIQMCTDVFDGQFDAEVVHGSVYDTNYVYGSRDGYKGTNVVMPNGSLDPWHALGKLTSTDQTVVPYLINGTAHCADMYPARAQDPPDLVTARTLIDDNLGRWIREAPIGTTTTSRPVSGQTAATDTTGLPETTTRGASTPSAIAVLVVLIAVLSAR